MAVLLRRRTPLDRLSDAFARGVAGHDSRPGTLPLLGVEHEFRVAVDGRPVDFRTLVHRIGLDDDGACVDPADPNAYRGTWGGAITADGREAEIAIPPVPLAAGFSSAALGLAQAGRRRLARGVPFGTLEGFSTHLNVSVPASAVERAGRRYAETFAPALMLILDSTSSPGLLIRPRPGRLELGGEFVDGDRLRAALVFAAGSALASARPAWRRWLPGASPEALRVEIAPSIERFGWYVDRRAFGPDLYAEGRSARLTTRRGDTVSAQSHLERCWIVARRELRGRASDEELGLVDELVRGGSPLGVEVPPATATALLPDAVSAGTADLGFGDALRTRTRPGYIVEPVVVGWDLVVLRVRAVAAAAGAYAALPRGALARGLAALDRGELDTTLRDALAAAEAGSFERILARAAQGNRPGLYTAIGPMAKLIASERGPETGERKERRRDDEHETERPRHDPDAAARHAATVAGATAIAALLRRPKLALAAAAGAFAVAVAGGALALAQLGSPAPAPSAPPSAGAVSSPAGSPTGAASSGPSTVPTTGALPSLDALSGDWSFTVANPRVVSATGNHTGGSVVIEGDRYVFSGAQGAVDYREEGPIDFDGPVTLDCRPTYCSFKGVPMFLLYALDQGPTIVDPVNLTPVGTYAGRCGWQDIPGGGLVAIEGTDVLRFTSGVAGGVGANCEGGGQVLAWDVTGTRAP